MSIWLWLAIVTAGGIPTLVLLYIIFCLDDDDQDDGPDG